MSVDTAARKFRGGCWVVCVALLHPVRGNRFVRRTLCVVGTAL